LAAAARRGVALWRLDRVATAADVVARDERKFRKDERVVGFVTREDRDAIVVSWVDATPAALVSRARRRRRRRPVNSKRSKHPRR
jgi:RNase adaptor protein for sRNA GlmZ degradation